MVRIFESIPGWIVQLVWTIGTWVAHNPMTFILVGFLTACALWLNLFLLVQRKTRQRDAARTANSSKPGSFPGDYR